MPTSFDQVIVRPILPTEFAEVGQLTRQAYLDMGTIEQTDTYVDTLADVTARVADDMAKVFVADVAGQVVATVTYCPFGSSLTVVCNPGDYEFRMLAVDTNWHRHGIAMALVNYCDAVAYSQGITTSIACFGPHNEAAHNLYLHMGFAPAPERDWWYTPSKKLLTYTREIGAPSD